jgi:hypothetical protein
MNTKKYKLVSNVLLPVLLILSSASHSQDDLSLLQGDYLGQQVPNSSPVPFAPGIVSTNGYEYGGVFNADMSEFIFIQGDKDKKHHFVTYKKNGDNWYQYDISPRTGQPSFSTDGKTMHLGNRYKERTEHGWSEIKSRTSLVTEQPIMRLTSSSNETYYFDEFKKDFTGDIRYSRLVDGVYESPKLAPKHINSGKSFHPFIAPDESYLIFDGKREGGYGDSDLYISFRQHDGAWGEAINLGDQINTGAWEAAASVTPDGKYFFFNRTISPGVNGALPNVDIYWVEADFIEKLRPKIE